MNKEKQIIRNVRGQGAGPKIELPKPYGIEAVETESKSLVFGPMGSGKTLFGVAGPLLVGEKVGVISTDFGGQGLRSVKEYLRGMDKEDLFENLRGLTLDSYSLVQAFLGADKPFGDFSPTVLVWDGFTNFQQDFIYDRARVKYPSDEQNLLYWGEVKTLSLRAMNDFLNLPGHKVVTALEDKPDTNDLTKQREISAFIRGAFKAIVGAGFDLVLHTFVDKENKYKYRSVGESSMYAVKSRGIDIGGPVVDADPEKVWRRILG